MTFKGLYELYSFPYGKTWTQDDYEWFKTCLGPYLRPLEYTKEELKTMADIYARQTYLDCEEWK